MGSLALEEELERAGRALSCAMTFPADFDFERCALMSFSCAWETGTWGEERPPSSASCPTIRERTIRADCFARRSELEKAEGFFAWSAGAAEAVAPPGLFSAGEGGALGLLRRSMK